MRRSLAFGLIVTALTTSIMALPSVATCGGGGGGGDGGTGGEKTYTVPWQKLATPDSVPKATMVVYWFPADASEYDKSSLRASRILALYGAHCMAMVSADPTSAVADKFRADGKLPAVVLANADNSVIARIEAGALADVAQVEKLVDDEMKKREQSLTAQLESGRNKLKAGDKDGAVADFRAVVEQKCLFPKPAKEAVKELKKLGVSDANAMIIPGENVTNPALSAKIEHVMAEGLKAENAENYKAAEALYKEAHKMDPNDPVPLRYLGELYRHHIGDWDTAAVIFKQILAMDSDPLSRAVALHGLGKMTIHNGDFKGGEAMIEESVKTYPLAMAYRNLAVYWNSEGDFAKADQYTKEALKLDSKDPFNIIFAAVFLAAGGNKEEALKVAKEHEDVLPASYNLAAIYAQCGQKDKALALLRRHFFQYERNRSVRSKEMMEARVDRVFDSIVDDPAFLALTCDADGKLPMRKRTKPGMQQP